MLCLLKYESAQIQGRSVVDGNGTWFTFQNSSSNSFNILRLDIRHTCWADAVAIYLERGCKYTVLQVASITWHEQKIKCLKTEKALKSLILHVFDFECRPKNGTGWVVLVVV